VTRSGHASEADGPEVPDKRLALKTLLELKDPKAILADSGWASGQALGRGGQPQP
jgi:hypothetical protein